MARLTTAWTILSGISANEFELEGGKFISPSSEALGDVPISSDGFLEGTGSSASGAKKYLILCSVFRCGGRRWGDYRRRGPAVLDVPLGVVVVVVGPWMIVLVYPDSDNRFEKLSFFW